MIQDFVKDFAEHLEKRGRAAVEEVRAELPRQGRDAAVLAQGLGISPMGMAAVIRLAESDPAGLARQIASHQISNQRIELLGKLMGIGARYAIVAGADARDAESKPPAAAN